MWPFRKNRSTDGEWQEWAVMREKAAYERGHNDGHGSGWTDGKTKAMQEILNVLEGRRHTPDCGCRPCLVIRACRGEIKVVEATWGIVDLGELPYFPDQVDGIMLISCVEAPEDDDCGIDKDGYCAHGRMCYRLARSGAGVRPNWGPTSKRMDG